MFRNILLSAAGAGLAACLAVGALQVVTTEPLIVHAEALETVEAAVPTGHRDEGNDSPAWQPADGVERTLTTLAADFLVGVAVSLLLLGAMVLKGDPIDARRGLLWGAAGFVAASLLPGLGLPPELPGTPAADLLGRQVWWLGTAAASAVGLLGLAFGRHWGWRVAGLALLVAPHLIGAPAPPSHEASYPAALAGEFVIASIVVSAALWSISGLTSGWLYRRLSQGG